ncbi:MAG: hypothetical protein JSU68_11500, partial [Phycisphaerales bacterium]
VDNGKLILEPSETADDQMGGTRLIPLQWGERLYLVPESGTRSFRQAVFLGEEPRAWLTGDFYLREGDHAGLPVETPVASGVWQEGFVGVRLNTIEAQLIGIVSDTRPSSDGIRSECHVTLDVGWRDGADIRKWLYVRPIPEQWDPSQARAVVLAYCDVGTRTTQGRIILPHAACSRIPPWFTESDKVILALWTVAPDEPDSLAEGSDAGVGDPADEGPLREGADGIPEDTPDGHENE